MLQSAPHAGVGRMWVLPVGNVIAAADAHSAAGDDELKLIERNSRMIEDG